MLPSRALSERDHENDLELHEASDAEEHQGRLQAKVHGEFSGHRRRRTIRNQRSESGFSSIESSPSSNELFIGGVARGSSRGRGGVRYGRNLDGHQATSGLVIPSLTLPPALKRPTPYGQTLGDLRLLVLARHGAAPGGKGFLATLLLEDNDDIVEVGEWEDPVTAHEEELDNETIQLGKAGAKVLRASTDWIEHTDAHGLEKYEPMRNVEVVELPGYDALTDVRVSTIGCRILTDNHYREARL